MRAEQELWLYRWMLQALVLMGHGRSDLARDIEVEIRQLEKSMNYYRAREIASPNGEPTGKFRFTVMNDNHIRAVGYCAERLCEHSTREEASDCFRRYCQEQMGGKCPGGFGMDTNWGQELIMSSSY